MKNRKLVIIIVIVTFLIIIMLSIIRNYQKKNPQQVNKDICNMVEKYVSQN